MTCWRRRQPRFAARPGFTLIEVLVVVVIIGIVSSVVLISLGAIGDDRDLEREARRIASLVELAADEAELQGRDFGIEFLRGGYRFVEYDPYFNSWAEVVGDDLLRPRSLPENVELALAIEDRRIELNERPAETGNKDDEEEDDDRDNPLVENYAPHSMILSNGDLSPFELTLRRLSDGAEEIVRVAPSGEIGVGDPDDDAV